MTSFVTFVDEESEGFDGQVCANSGVHDTCYSSGNINPGLLICLDASTGKGKAPTTAAEAARVVGATEYKPLWMPASASYAYDANDPLPYMRQGEIRLVCEEAMAIGDAVYVRHTAKGGNTVLGAIRNDADPATDGVTLTVTAAANGQVYDIEVDGVLHQITYTDASPSTAEAATAIAAYFDALSAYVAPVPGASIVTLTRADGAQPVLGAVDASVTAGGNTDDTCALVSNVRVAKAATAAGNVKCNILFP